MFHSETSVTALGWQIVRNQYAMRTSVGLSSHVLKPVRKIKRTTRLLNRELKKFAKLKSYSQYVKIKKNFLKKIHDKNFEDEAHRSSSGNSETSTSQKSFPDGAKTTVSKTMHERLVDGQSKATKRVQKVTGTTKTGDGKLRIERSKTSKHKQETTKDTKMTKEKFVRGFDKALTHGAEPLQTMSAKKRACVRRNLTPLLDTVGTTNLLADRTKTAKTSQDKVDKRNSVSLSKTLVKRSILLTGNIPTGDSGIDDDSQDNSSTNNRENYYSMELDNITATSSQTDKRSEDSETMVRASNETLLSSASENDDVSMDEKDEEKREREEIEKAKMIEEINGREEIEEENMIEEEEIEEEMIKKEGKGQYEIKEEMIEEEIMEEGEMGRNVIEDEMIKAEEKGRQEIATNSLQDEEMNEDALEEDTIETEDMDNERKESEKIEEAEIEAKETRKLKIEEADNEDEQEKTEEDTLRCDVDDELSKKKCQPTIMCTEIVTSKYKIIRDESDEWEDEREERRDCTEENSPEHHINLTLDDSKEMDEKSPESKRVKQLKRMNLFCSGSESDASESDENFETRNVSLHNTSRPSQRTSDFSDSESPSDSSSFHITDSDDDTEISHRHDNDEKISPKTKVTAKSIKDQIEKQDIDDTSRPFVRENANASEDEEETEELDRSNERYSKTSENIENVGSKGKHSPTTQTTLQYAFKNVSESSFNENEFDTENTQERDPLALSPDFKTMSRPIELPDFVAREGLIPTCELSSITAKDIPMNSEEHEDDDTIWLMEIPRSVVADPELCGKSMLIRNGSIRIGETNYETTLRHEEIVSCIFRSRKKKARYKTVNIKPVCSINIRHERVEPMSFNVTQTPRSSNSVPFPKNLKVRNPLTTEKERRVLSSKNTHQSTIKEKEKQKGKKLKKDIWHMDNFISKSKKRRIDTP